MKKKVFDIRKPSFFEWIGNVSVAFVVKKHPDIIKNAQNIVR